MDAILWIFTIEIFLCVTIKIIRDFIIEFSQFMRDRQVIERFNTLKEKLYGPII